MNEFDNYLFEFGYDDRFSTEDRSISCDFTFMKLRDGLLRIGHILKEDFENNVYVVSIQSGFFGSNNAIVICKLCSGTLNMFAFAREGLIKQDTCRKALDKIEGLLK